MRQNSISLVLLLVISVFYGVACAQPQNEKAVLWKISGNGLEEASYLFGTMHLLPEEEYRFSENAQKAFDACTGLALEVDIVNMSMKDKLSMAKRVMMPEEESVEKYMSEKEFQQLEDFITDSLGLRKRTFKQIISVKPLFSSGILLKELVEDPKSYEQELGDAAKEKGMTISGLETMNDQLVLFEDISIEDQVKGVFLKEMTVNPMVEYNELKQIYLDGDLAKLQELTLEETEFENFQEKFILNRNRNWIPVIEDLIKKEPTFIAVGAAHLPGEEGVIALLKKAGYKLEPISE